MSVLHTVHEIIPLSCLVTGILTTGIAANLETSHLAADPRLHIVELTYIPCPQTLQ